MPPARRAVTTVAASALLILGGIALATPAQAKDSKLHLEGKAGDSKSDKSAVLKNFVNDIEFGILADGHLIYFKDLKQQEEIPSERV